MDNSTQVSRETSVPYAMIRDILQGAYRQGIDCSHLLENVGIDPISFPYVDGRLSLKDCARLLRNLWLEMGDESGGSLSRPMTNGSFALMTYAALSGDTLRDVFHHCALFMRVCNDDLHIELQENGEEAALQLYFTNPHGLDPCFSTYSWFIILIRFGSWMINRPILLDRVSFTFPPPIYAAEFPDMFPCMINFSQLRNTVTFNRAILDAKVSQDNATLKSFLANAPENLLTHFRSDDSLAGKVKLLLQHNHNERPGFEQAAEMLNLTTYTLRRYLKKEGTSFQQIKDSVNRNIAQHQLIHTDMPIADIAINIGYSEAAAFNHAFKKWTGMSPGKFRQHYTQPFFAQ